jgi:CMP-N,N'-diacetyllegionaminic acid synthase
MKKNILAIIPARGGSKRIPNKNVRNFLGMPLVAYTIKLARACDFIDRVMVDTDSLKVAKIAREFKAETPWLRPKKLAQDNSKVVKSILYDLDQFKKRENYQPDYVIILQTTSPLLEIKDIKECWQMMENTKADTVLTICPTHPRLYYLDKKQNIILANGRENQSTNIQAWRPAYILNGFVYIVKTSALLKEKSIITNNTKALICDKWRSIDLDEMEDWALAEYIYKNRKKIVGRINQLYDKK